MSESSTPTKESKSFGSEASTGVATSSPGNPGKRKDMSHLREDTPEFNHAALLESHKQLRGACESGLDELIGLSCYLETCEKAVILNNIGMLLHRMNDVRAKLEVALAKAKEITDGPIRKID